MRFDRMDAGPPTGVSRRRLILGTLLGAAAAPALLSSARAENFPARPVRMVVTVSAGGGADATARLTASKLADLWGQPVVVENRVGATGMIGAELVAKSTPDGYTALFASTSLVQAPALFPNAPYDIARDFAPVSQIAGLAVVFVVNAASPYRTLKDYLAAAHRNQPPVTYGSMGTGSSLHIFGATLAKDAAANLVHVPYKGEAPALNDLVGGHVDSCFASVASAAPLIAGGRLRPLAVVGETRVPLLPDVPTFVELGFPHFSALGWYGILLPAGTAEPIVAKFATDVAAVMKRNDIAKSIRDGGNTPMATAPQEFKEMLARDFAKWRQLIQQADIKPPA
jgi:tripartite-type tricarboxylate transporter receptor subunit TctC